MTFTPSLRRSSTFIFVAWLILAMPTAVLRAEASATAYRGFTIDDSRIRNLPNHEALRTATQEQIDIVCAVGVPAEILQFFRSVPFNLVPAGAISSGTPGLYGGKDRSVKVSSGITSVGHKPVLLHELLHAYHDQRLKGGFKNPDILAYFERAKTIANYASKSHMMQNEKEFFACAATTYLFGVTAQEPFRREKLAENQADFYGYLKELFGTDAGSYAGSLAR